jgi:hypothetical protein
MKRFLVASFLILALSGCTSGGGGASSDNWVIGTWATTTTPALNYVFTASDVTLKGPNGNLGPFKVTSYDIKGDTIVITAQGLPGKATITKSDATHAKFDDGSGTPADIVKQ